jgi:CRISPR/Cas system-associated protein endoribonuclease Cas2
MTTAFVDFPAQQQAKQQIADNVVKYTQMLIEALKHNFVQYSIRGHQRSAEKGDSVEYHLRKVEEMKSGKCDIDYVIETGKKYHKVVMIDGGSSRSVHCFIDKQTGEMYKSASWKSPAKGVRYDLRLIKDREYVFENCDWAGGYLYAA